MVLVVVLVVVSVLVAVAGLVAIRCVVRSRRKDAGDDVVASEPVLDPVPVDDVVRSLIDRARGSDDITAVVAAMVEEDLDNQQMEEVLMHLVERDRVGVPGEELTLTGPEVPHRPGQLHAFADLSDDHKRRVIIRVLCLLIARADDGQGVEVEPETEPAPADAHLPVGRLRRVTAGR